jgi:hypothetical protein
MASDDDSGEEVASPEALAVLAKLGIADKVVTTSAEQGGGLLLSFSHAATDTCRIHIVSSGKMITFQDHPSLSYSCMTYMTADPQILELARLAAESRE